MATEIERKFLVLGDGWLSHGLKGVDISQGYLTTGLHPSIRVRCKAGKGFLTIKDGDHALNRFESEFEIPFYQAQDLLNRFCARSLLAKTRFTLSAGSGLYWEIDVFHGALDGLVLAEIELPEEQALFEKPDWLGPEVTGDPRYLNANLLSLSAADTAQLVNESKR